MTLKNGDKILVETKTGKIEVIVEITEDILDGVVNLTHGWGGIQNQNMLTDLEPLDPITGYPELRALACRIRKTESL